MQNLRKNKNKVITTQMMNLTNEEAIDTETCDEMNRGCKGKPNNMYNNNNCVVITLFLFFLRFCIFLSP